METSLRSGLPTHRGETDAPCGQLHPSPTHPGSCYSCGWSVDSHPGGRAAYSLALSLEAQGHAPEVAWRMATAEAQAVADRRQMGRDLEAQASGLRAVLLAAQDVAVCAREDRLSMTALADVLADRIREWVAAGGVP